MSEALDTFGAAAFENEMSTVCEPCYDKLMAKAKELGLWE